MNSKGTEDNQTNLFHLSNHLCQKVSQVGKMSKILFSGASIDWNDFQLWNNLANTISWCSLICSFFVGLWTAVKLCKSFSGTVLIDQKSVRVLTVGANLKAFDGAKWWRLLGPQRSQRAPPKTCQYDNIRHTKMCKMCSDAVGDFGDVTVESTVLMPVVTSE